MLTIKNTFFKISNRFSVGPIHLDITRGSHVALIGESGCGKTTLLKMVYGLYDLDQGSIYWGNQEVTGPKENLVPGMSFTKYLSQDFDLMPFTSVEENINKYLSRLQPEVNKKRTAELMEVVEMSAFAKVKVKTLSGGQKQRVALAQTLAKEPELLLLDEPFSHIDNSRKNKLRRTLFRYLKKQQITCLIATHDSTDVLAYMDETVVLRDGGIIAQGKTASLFEKPPSYYVGSLFGDINELPKSWFYEDFKEGENILLYPHRIEVVEKGIRLHVQQAYFMGTHFLIVGTAGNTTILFNSEKNISPNEVVHVGLKK